MQKANRSPRSFFFLAATLGTVEHELRSSAERYHTTAPSVGKEVRIAISFWSTYCGERGSLQYV